MYHITKLCETDSSVRGITVDNTGNIYFSTGRKTIFRVSKDDSTTRSYITTPLFQLGAASLYGIVWTKDNIIYACDMVNDHVISYSVSNGEINTFAGSLRGYKDGPLLESQFCDPWGITKDNNGNLYVTDDNHIRKIDLTKRIVETIAGCGTGWLQRAHLDGEALSAKFATPTGVAVSDDGIIYVCDRNNDCVRKIQNGIVSTITRGITYPENIAVLPNGDVCISGMRVDIRIGNREGKMKIVKIPGLGGKPCLAYADNSTLYVASELALFKVEEVWKWERFLWIGHVKETSECFLTHLPKEIVKEIASWVHTK